MREFFVPFVSGPNVEPAFAALAEWCSSPVPPMKDRIYSIRYARNGVTWEATVGETLSGSMRKERKHRGQRVVNVVPYSDPATVLAIFNRGVCFVVVTDNQRGTRHENPFYASSDATVTYFAAASAQS